MRWLTLYARSRQVPGSAAAIALVSLALWVLHSPGPMDLGTAVLVLTANVAAASAGLGGWDVALERTAAIRWMPRRAAHVLLIGAAAGLALLTVQTVGVELAPTAVVVRDSAGLVGLAALGAALFGAQFAWTPPTAWLAVTLLVPVPDGRVGEVVHWMLFPSGTSASAAIAWALLATGTVAYAVAGPRR
ncbi:MULTISPECIES: hypothetical protein [unclassified Kitasatospora]|uniref:hypothetical protein n=1 Tax=unclassified Kitasatospora TaxID=2633591 RepID=UPI001AE0549D|nr:hypothetical protein [Kitasatospora sp. RG8]MBP0453141.1 hypothetical protein [Kitasatospora sp. RG8]